jgi:hypothetical protein
LTGDSEYWAFQYQFAFPDSGVSGESDLPHFGILFHKLPKVRRFLHRFFNELHLVMGVQYSVEKAGQQPVRQQQTHQEDE